MKKFINFFKNRIVISIIGLLAFSVLIWFIGPQIKFGDDNSAPLASAVSRLVAIIIVVVLWGLNNLRIQMQNKKQNEEFVEDLEKNQRQDVKGGTNDQSAKEIQQIGERFTQALATLKQTKFKGANSDKSLYELPWYIIIGPPGSGKTTALINSTLDFPLAKEFGKAALQGVGGTRNCDWWFTNDAVLVDTAGRYTTQDSHKVVDSSAWEGFLNLLKRNRKRRPINGAIIAISLQDLMIQSDEERIMHAKTIRSRIDELMDKLEIRFPIYLMFTKSDLVSGFSEFFEDLSKEDREQVWGISLPNAPKVGDSPDFEYLDDEYRSLLQRLYDRVLWRVHQERDVNRRGVIQGFPQQMENLQSIVLSFVKQTFSKNRYQLQPYLRGVYFTSGTQDGTPIDRLMTSVASSFGFAREAAHMPQQQGKSYFLGNLFKHVIFPEAELVGSNRRYEKFLYWMRKVGYVSMAAVSTMLIIVWAGSLTQHDVFMGEVEDNISTYNIEKKRLNVRNKDLRVTLPSLNALYRASLVYDKDDHPWLSGMGLYDGNVDATADKAYQEKLKILLLPRLVDYVASYLKQGHRGGDLYNTFRVYLMFNKLERMDKQLISEWFTNNLNKHLHGEGTKRKELLLHMQNLLALKFASVKLSDPLVKSTRALLLRVPASQRIYERIRTNPENNEPVELVNAFGESVRDTFIIDHAAKKNLTIPWMFTLDGYKSIDLTANSEYLTDIMGDSWVLTDGNKEKVDFIKDDLDEISKQVKDHYLSEYVQTWQTVLDSLHVAEFKNLTQATEILAILTDPIYSPLLTILQVSKDNTELTPVLDDLPDIKLRVPGKAGRVGRAASLLGSQIPKNFGNKVDKHFASVNVLLREVGNRPAQFGTIMSKIQQLHDFVDGILLAPDPGKQAFDISRARFQNSTGNAITAMESYAKKAPAPIKQWLETLADQTWKVVLVTGRQYLNSEWRTQVYTPYSQNIAHSYPFNRGARDELTVIDFSEFFKPGGIIDAFKQQFVAPFINTRTWKNRSVGGRSMAISNKVLTQLKKAKLIKDIFFRINKEIPSISFELKPDSMSKNNARFTLELGGERISYNHGPKFWKTLTWSGESDDHRVRLVFEDLRGSFHSKIYDGPWAWFRLQDNSNLKNTTRSKVYRVTYSVDRTINSSSGRSLKSPHNIDYLIKAKSVNNPFSKNLLGGFRCPASI